ncbi:MAG: 2-oxo acid dehydrogenase subunit E2 [Oscillospiraceae bacterium]|nr:2-oxo acid dehydrogenase subunit E2 [Oscillospiraceae bacterium]
MAIGDRKDGVYLKKINTFYSFIPFIMSSRVDSLNTFEDSVEITEIDRFLRAKRESGMKGIGMLHLFIAAYIRVVSQLPALNRFVAGQRIYAAKEIVYVMSVKKEMSTRGEETSIKVKFEPRDTIDDVYRKLSAEITAAVSGQDTKTDSAAALLGKMPRLLLKFVMWIIRIVDYFGKLPRFLLDASPFHGSFIITDIGSLGIQPIFHHLYNFGTLPVFLAFGAKRKVYEVQKDGTVEQRKYIDYKISTDERICDGFYFAQALKYLKSYLRHPELLEQPPEEIKLDPDL